MRDIIVGALFEFAMYLMEQPKPIDYGGSSDQSEWIARHLQKWAEKKGLNLQGGKADWAEKLDQNSPVSRITDGELVGELSVRVRALVTELTEALK